MGHLLAADPAQQMAKQGCLCNTKHSLQAPGSEFTLSVPQLSRPGHGARLGDSRSPTALLALETARVEHLQRASPGNRIQEAGGGEQLARWAVAQHSERREVTSAGRAYTLCSSIWAPRETGAIRKGREVSYFINARLLASLHRPCGRWESETGEGVAMRAKGVGRNRWGGGTRSGGARGGGMVAPSRDPD